VIIGGGVAGYVAAIKAGQEGLKVRFSASFASWVRNINAPGLHRLPVSRSAASLAEPASTSDVSPQSPS
jgi:predicted flavoprotein YhiN